MGLTQQTQRRSPLRIGLVTGQDPALCRVRIKFPDLDQVTSYWLPIAVPKTQNDKAYWIPDIGEQVVCLMDDHDEAGAVLGAIYSQADATPVQSADKFHLQFKDGASFEYDRAAHKLSVGLPNGGTVSVSANGASLTIDGSGNVNIVAPGLIKLGGQTLKGVARLGDQVTCPAGIGTITSASSNVLSD